MARSLLIRFLLATVLGAGAYALHLSASKPNCVGNLGHDGFRRDLFRGILPPALGVACQ